MAQNELLDALHAIPAADLDYAQWCEVGMALKDAGLPVSAWADWSARDGTRYKPGECEKKWDTFRGTETPVTAATVYHLAQQFGWRKNTGQSLDWDGTIAASEQIIDPNWIEKKALDIPDEWAPHQQLIAYLDALFEPSESVGYVMQSWQKDGRYLPAQGCWDRTAGQLIAALAACDGDIGGVLGDYDPAAGAWIRFNPLDGHGCKNDNVTEYRYALIESDELDLETQNALIHKLNLPVAALVYSGGKSLHAVVHIDAANYAEYRKRVNYLYDVCQKNGLKPDSACRNPSRLSRMPGVLRGGQKQYLLETRFGAADWESWVNWVESETDNLPDPESLADTFADLPPLAPPLIDSVLRQGHKLLLAGPSKAGKSFALIELCICIAEGAKWLGQWRCAPGRVLYINLELDRASCLHRFADVYRALKLPPAHVGQIDVWNLRGAAVPMDQLAPKLIRRAKQKGYLAVVIDPIYKVITGDENAADQMARFCNQFDRIARELHCAVIYCHHHSKGAQGGKRSMDRASGSGVFARDPDAILDMVQLEPTAALRKQLENNAVCKLCCAVLDKRGLSDVYSQDDACSRARMRAICAQQLSPADLRMLDIDADKAAKAATAKTAWRIEGTLREFQSFPPVNLWFDFPTHVPDTDGLLADLSPDCDPRSSGRRGSQTRWADGGKEKCVQKSAEKLQSAFDATAEAGESTIYAMANYLDLKPETVRKKLKASDVFWLDDEKVGRKKTD